MQKSVYAYTNIENIDTEQPTKVIPYAYNSNGWRDQLASYNGKGMVYDLLGNPTVYRNTKLTWKYGRQLIQYGDISSYTYLSDGTRRTKTVDGKTTTYTRLDGKLIGETDGKNTIAYLYGIDGIYGFQLNGATYMYGKDLQGNVIEIMDMSGNVLAKYVYDAFGNHKAYAIVDGAEQQVYDSMTGESAKVKISYNSALISNGKLSMVLGYTGSAVINAKIPLVIGCQSNATGNEFLEHDSIALINPIRYRGYYYDQETGLYYLQSRYYDSEVGRFINADDISYLDPETLGGLNLYAYCGNNPVMMTDSSGNRPTGFQGLFTVLERFFTGLYEFCKYIVDHPEKFTVTWKQYHKSHPKESKNSFIKGNDKATAQTKNMGKTFGKIAKVAGYATLAFDIGATWYKNYNSGSSTWVTDSIVDTAYIGTRFAIGVAINSLCSLIPGVGWLVGIVVSIGVDYLIQWAMGSGALAAIKTWAEEVGQSISNGWKKFWSFGWI